MIQFVFKLKGEKEEEEYDDDGVEDEHTENV